MSDSEDSTVTYTAVSSPFGGLSDIRSPRVDGPPMMLEDPYTYVVAAFQAPPSPDYVSGPEYTPLPEFVLEPVYLEFMPPEDDVLPAEEQPLPAAISPTADSPGYVPESNHEEDLEEDDDEDPKDDPADYPTDRDDDEEEEKEPSRDEADDEEEDEDDEEEEEDPALADSIPPPVYHVTARISIRAQTPIPLSSNTEVARLLVIPTPPPSPLSPWSSPLPQISSPPLPVSSPLLVSPPPPANVPPSRTPPILPIPLPTSSPSLLLPSTDHGADMPEVCFPPRKRLCFAFGPREIRRDPKREVGYGNIDTLDEMLEDMPGALATDETELGRRMTNFVTTVRQDKYEIYVRLGEAQDERSAQLTTER
ncbi:hypothetical protein Tco_0889035 [Tanacetum coccineum]